MCTVQSATESLAYLIPDCSFLSLEQQVSIDDVADLTPSSTTSSSASSSSSTTTSTTQLLTTTISSHNKSTDYTTSTSLTMVASSSDKVVVVGSGNIPDDSQELNATNLINEEEEEEEDEEDMSKILNMSLIKGVLQASGAIEYDDEQQQQEEEEGSPSRKSVSFSGVDSVDSSKGDEQKTQGELISKLGKTQAKLTGAQVDLSAEKAIRKKKEKNLVKLAKELNKRAADQKMKEAVIANLQKSIIELDAKLVATRNEMDDRIATADQKTSDYNSQLDAAHSKYRLAVEEHDKAVATIQSSFAQERNDMRAKYKDVELECQQLKTQTTQANDNLKRKTDEWKKTQQESKQQLTDAAAHHQRTVKQHEKQTTDLNAQHGKQMDEMRRQLLQSNLECDKIRTELASFQMKQAPDDAAEIVNRTMNASKLGGPSAAASKRKRSQGKSFFMGLMKFVGIVVVVILAVAYEMQLLNMNSICSPIAPGTVLEETSSFTMEAPWWVPAKHKAEVFDRVCSGRRRTSLDWEEKKLMVHLVGDDASKPLMQKQATSVTVDGNTLHFNNRKGKIEALRAPWAK